MKKNNALALIAILTVTLTVLLMVAIFALDRETPAPTPTQPVTQPTTLPAETEPTQPPTEPPVTKVGTATVYSVGDVLMHMSVVNTGYNADTGEYDQFHRIFDYVTDYTTTADLMVGNLETTLAGLDNGYQYNGYPNFNCPDGIIDGMKAVGFDIVLTANNHSYDTRTKGFNRTTRTIAERGLDYLGTKMDANEPDYIISDCNGIQIGLMCYTYETGTGNPNTVALNGISLTEADSKLVNTFNEKNLDAFYAEIEANIAQMKVKGAETVVLYLHWGWEYNLSPNTTQKNMAQELCDLGVDVIIGGHPHVVQPIDLLTSTTDPNHKTVCLYSMGNAVSNQRLGNLSNVSTAHTEDGVMMRVTFAEYSDGTVIIESADVLPFWVWMHYDEDWNKLYQIMPLEGDPATWQTRFGVNDDVLQKLQDSYDRTMAVMGNGLTEVVEYCTTNQQQVEAALGVQ